MAVIPICLVPDLEQASGFKAQINLLRALRTSLTLIAPFYSATEGAPIPCGIYRDIHNLFKFQEIFYETLV